MTKTYRRELKGAIRGNARLRHRLDKAKRREAELVRHVQTLVVMLDASGRGQEQPVNNAARAVGWDRLPPGHVVRLIRRAKELLP